MGRLRRAGRTSRGALGLVALLAVVAVPAARPASSAGFRLTVELTGQGLVRSTPSRIACGERCSAVFPAGTVVRLALVRVHRYFSFEQWGGECVGDLRTCFVIVDGPRSVRVIFSRNPVDLELSVGGRGRVRSSPAGIDCGSGHDSCEGTFGQGTKVVLNASPGAGAAFATWSAPCRTAPRCVLSVPSDTFATATFRRRYRFTVGTAAGAQGDVACEPSCEGLMPSDRLVTATATPRPGSHFEGWSGACSGARSVCRFVNDAPSTVVATFAAGEPPAPAAGSLPVVVTVGGPGGVSGGGVECGATCATLATAGASVRLIAQPTAASIFVGWTGDCAGGGACELAIDGPKSVGAVFRRKYPLVTDGFPTVSAPRRVVCRKPCLFASDVLVTLAAGGGSSQVDWSGNACVGVAPRCRVVADGGTEVGAQLSVFGAVRSGLTGYGINVSVSGRGTVVSKDGAIRCGYKRSVVDGCHASFEPGTTIELQAVPAKGAKFVGWQGFCTGTGTCRLKMNATKTVYAVFGR